MEPKEIEGKTCPFRNGPCRSDCQLLCGSQETTIRKCAFAVIAQQLDMLAEKGSKRF